MEALVSFERADREVDVAATASAACRIRKTVSA
jgi:hypothetical protein